VGRTFPSSSEVIPAGEYPLLVGLYDPNHPLRRLPLPTTRGDQLVDIGSLTISDGALTFTKHLKGEARVVLARPTGGANVELMTEWLLGPWIPQNERVSVELVDTATGVVVASTTYAPTTSPSSWPYLSRWREQRLTLSVPLPNSLATLTDTKYTVRTSLIDTSNVRVPLSSANPSTRKISQGTLSVTDNGSNITQLRFWPTGTCVRYPVADHWGAIDLAAATDPTPRWKQVWGDPSVDVAHDTLHLTFDDVVRWQEFDATDGMAISFSVTLNGNIAFSVQPTLATGTQNFPAIRRVGGHLELGGLRYGMSESWGTFSGFTGQQIANRDTVRVTVFTRRGRELAMRVEDGKNVYQSGFSAFSNLGQIQLIGGNTNGDDSGSIDVGPVEGCTGLDMSETTAVYSR
jgi:hypothetical protein